MLAIISQISFNYRLPSQFDHTIFKQFHTLHFISLFTAATSYIYQHSFYLDTITKWNNLPNQLIRSNILQSVLSDLYNYLVMQLSIQLYIYACKSLQLVMLGIFLPSGHYQHVLVKAIQLSTSESNNTLTMDSTSYSHIVTTGVLCGLRNDQPIVQ